jgi:hypothetical protein
VNLWEYDAAEVWYADGRIQLQGANESGKSTLMTLTALLLLASDTSGHNIDTLGASDKHFRYYVEPTDHALDRRDASTQKNRGWAWLDIDVLLCDLRRGWDSNPGGRQEREAHRLTRLLVHG